MTSDKISIIFSVDIGFDNISKISEKKGKNNLKNLEYVSEISKIINQKISPFCKPKISWLISDNKLLIEKFLRVRDSVVMNYDEIGMHCMISYFNNLRFCKKHVIESYIEKSMKLFEDFSLYPSSSRIMGCASSNDLISVLANSGFKVDSSAIPKRSRTKTIEFDWLSTPPTPYFPSLLDYRIPSKKTSSSHRILEVPLSTIKTQTTYDKFPVLRYLDLCFSHKIITENIEEVVSRNKILVTIIHPNQLLPKTKKCELYSKDISEFTKNLIKMTKIFEKSNKKIECLTLSEMPKLFNYSTHQRQNDDVLDY